MKRFLPFIAALFLSLYSWAQLEVKEDSFKLVPGFVNINTEKMYDDNDKPYAVLKIKTENISSKERRELSFKGDAQTFFEIEYKDGEIWLYISYYATFIKISHDEFSSTEFWFPYDMKPKCGYELTLVNKQSLDKEILKRLEKLESASAASTDKNPGYGYIMISTTPVDGATVYIDGEEMSMKTPCVSDKLSVGDHSIQIVKDMYKPYVAVVKLEAGETKNINAKLEHTDGEQTYYGRNKGFDIIPTVSGLYTLRYGLLNNPGFAFVPAVNAKYMIGPKLGLGGGLGYIYSLTGPHSISVAVDITYMFGKNKVKPFVSLQPGYLISITSYKNTETTGWGMTDYSNSSYSGPSWSFTLGANVKRSLIGLTVKLNRYIQDYQQFWSGSELNGGKDDGYSYSIGLTYSYIFHVER